MSRRVTDIKAEGPLAKNFRETGTSILQLRAFSRIFFRVEPSV